MYNFEMLPRVKDVRDTLVKHPTKLPRKRNISRISHITVHHSATTVGSAESYARFHVGPENNWPTIGYHFVIEQDGTIKWCNNPDILSYHVGDSNGFTLGVCLTGDFKVQSPTVSQWDSLYRLLKALMIDFNVSKENIWGHSEFKQYSWKQCPCLVMNEVRDNAVKSLDSPTPPKVNISEPQYYTIKKGDTFWKIAESLGYISLGELMKLNKGIDPRKLQIGDKIIIKEGSL